jgi:hypothetical protein
MSKKLFATPEWKRRIARAQARELANTRRRKKPTYRRDRAFSRARAPKRSTASLTVPAVFSLIDNPNETIAFLNEFERVAGKKNINLDLQGIVSISIDAITALTALVRRLRYTQINGNLPVDSGCLSILAQSGFFEHVKHRQPLPSADRGKMAHQQSKKVEGKLAQQLIHRVTSAIYGTVRVCKPAYRALIESMTNTNDHAARTDFESETWWATAYADTNRKCACFAFLDTGVGIFQSVRLGAIRRAYQFATKLVGLRTDADILKEVLQGKVASSTGLDYRGKGLPALYDALMAGRLSALVIVSNGVYADVKKDDFRTLDFEFRGTLLYWEA